MKKFLVTLIAIVATCSLLVGCTRSGTNKPHAKILLYTSMKENIIGGIAEGFKRMHPEIDVEYKVAGAGKIMENLASERQKGKILADIIWTSEVSDFYQMKAEGLLLPYQPREFSALLNPFDDYDGSFTAARLGTLGIAINTDKVKKEPTSWEEIASDPFYKGNFGIADPTMSGTAFMSIALLEKEFGWSYIESLKQNDARKLKGSSQVVEAVAKGNLAACLAVDYIAANLIDKREHLALVYPKELVMVPSPIAIFKDTENAEAAKLFVDYVLSQEAQQKVAEAGTVPVREDIKMPAEYLLPLPQEALKNGIKVDYAEVLARKDDTLAKFNNLYK